MALQARHRNQAAVAALLLVFGCSTTQPLEWEEDAARALQAFQRHYLVGNTTLAEVEFRRARSEVGSTGRGDLIARVELMRCAVRAASLELDGCPGFQKVRDLARGEEHAYAEYLLGNGAHTAGADPLAQVVAAAVQLRRGTITPATIASTVDIASAQGWRRPLLAWLGVQAKRAEDAGDAATAARIRRRMDLVSQ